MRLGRHEDLGSNPQHLYKKADAVACVCHHKAGDVETGGSPELSDHSLAICEFCVQ